MSSWVNILLISLALLCGLIGSAWLWTTSASLDQYLRGEVPPPSSFLLTLEKLKDAIGKESDSLIYGLVAHRGFHYADDDMKRPLENTLAAYERAWSAGVKYCECDVRTTKDGEIVLGHDETLKRLALRPEQGTKKVREMNYAKELELIPLKDGSRVPKLQDILAGAKRIGSNPRLIVEIKEKDLPCARKLAETVLIEGGERISVVMSFALESVREFAKLNTRRGKVLSMLLTVKADSKDQGYSLDLNHFSSLEKILKDNQIDGLYAQYDQTFLSDGRFAALCKRYPIGVWGIPRDAKSTAQQLIAKGARFVNTDFVDDFFHM